MATEVLQIFLLPLLAPGHMLPMVDMARVFADHGAKSTLVTTPANAFRIQDSVAAANAAASLRHPIQILTIQLPEEARKLMGGRENLADFPSSEVTDEFVTAMQLLREPFQALLTEHGCPDCLVSDAHYTWSVELGLPRLFFTGSSSFLNAVMSSLALHRPFDGEETFVVPGIPHQIEMKRSQLPDFILEPKAHILNIRDSLPKSYGSVVNSFYHLEPEYAGGGHRNWHIGPLSLCNRSAVDRAARGDRVSVDLHQCLRWLDSKEERSVLYICFGSLGAFPPVQMREIALALDSSSHPFIWVARDRAGDLSEWLPEGFEERNLQETEAENKSLSSSSSKGLLIRGWAPQILILNHRAVGGFVTHCGWNSTLEGVCAGVPMVTWPLFADQFCNALEVVHVLRTGVDVGVERCSDRAEERDMVSREKILRAVEEVMGTGEEAEGRRKMAEELAEKSRRAVEEGGSSYNAVRSLFEELTKTKTKAKGLSL